MKATASQIFRQSRHAQRSLPSSPAHDIFHTTSRRTARSVPRRTPLLNGISSRYLHSAQVLHDVKSNDRGPASTEDTQTDFAAMDVLGNTPGPTTAIDACLSDGFQLDNGVKIRDGSGCLLIMGEAFKWRPWEGPSGASQQSLRNKKGQWECPEAAWGVLDLVWPKPDLLILGLGPSMLPIAPNTRAYLNSLGIRIEVQDTRNAAAQFNLLATERGVRDVAAALVPLGR
ncbi:MAG: hypothetical protein M1833_002195 [Piccolia ochrophora]|nr:MAG: hypothetical protein M1833_002195 [Piccolia ochrophora]